MHPLDLPLTLTRLRSARDDTERDDAWAQFVSAHSDVVLHACRSVMRDPDGAMDGYAFVLESLRGNACQRLRAYAPDGKTKFSTWLLVVSRRLALDYYRHRYGRSRSEDESRQADQVTRRRLEDLVVEKIDPDQIEDASASAPDARLRREQMGQALRRSLGELTPEDHLLLVLRFRDERPVREIASALALPTVFHVYRRLGVVLARLRNALASRGVEEPEP